MIFLFVLRLAGWPPAAWLRRAVLGWLDERLLSFGPGVAIGSAA
jgi:hypothetical protein